MTTPKLTKAMREALESAYFIDGGNAHCGVPGYVPGRTGVKRALTRRGFIDAQGCITDAGRAALKDGAK